MNNKGAAAGKARRKAGVRTLIPAPVVIDHLNDWFTLNPYATPTDAGRALGMTGKTLHSILTAPAGRMVQRRTAARILSLPLTRVQVGPGALVPGVVSRRMVEALMAQGWPLHQIARMTGITAVGLSHDSLTPSCHAATEQAIRRVFDQLKFALGPSERTRQHAVRYGFLPWQAWDGNILDPNATPDLTGLRREHARAWEARQAHGGRPLRGAGAATLRKVTISTLTARTSSTRGGGGRAWWWELHLDCGHTTARKATYRPDTTNPKGQRTPADVGPAPGHATCPTCTPTSPATLRHTARAAA